MPHNRLALGRSLNAVIVNYRTSEDCIGCVESLLKYRVIQNTADIVVVDNASGDDSPEVIRNGCRGITFLEAPTNTGFGGGVNLGVENCSADFVLVLNPDTRFVDYSINAALQHFDDPTVGIVGLKLINPDGTDQHSARTFYSLSTIIVRRTPLKKFLPAAKALDDQHLKIDSSEVDVPWVVGAGFIVRRDLFVSLGGMDEGFFIYLEDTDLCRRVWRAGFKVQIARSATLMHMHRAESKKSPFSRRNIEHLRSLLRYTSKFGLPPFGHDKD